MAYRAIVTLKLHEPSPSTVFLIEALSYCASAAVALQAMTISPALSFSPSSAIIRDAVASERAPNHIFNTYLHHFSTAGESHLHPDAVLAVLQAHNSYISHNMNTGLEISQLLEGYFEFFGR